MRRPKVAFVGSGGAVKGVAHFGILRAMEELGIVPDIYVGTSTGAIAGVFAAQGFRAEEMMDWVQPTDQRQDGLGGLRARHFLGAPSRAQLTRPGWLLSGLFSLDRFEAFLRTRLPINDFRRLTKPVLITATDVDGRGRAVFGQGYRDDVPISAAVAASCSVPVLFRPYRIEDGFYVDGEIVRTLSVDLAVEAGADIVIISNVYRPHVSRRDRPRIVDGGAISVARQTLNIVLSEKEKRGIDLIHRLYPHVTVLNVSAELGRFPFLARRQVGRVMTRGYREGLRVLAAAKRRGIFELSPNMRTIGNA